MKIPCMNPKCGTRRAHHERPDEPRGQRMCEVPDDHKGAAFCSITCACEAGAYSITKGWLVDPATYSPAS